MMTAMTLGSSSQEWRNLYIDGTANIDSLVADTADINGGTIDGTVIGGSTAAAITGTTITGTSFVIGSADISEAELEILDGATVTTDELNILDGVTATTAELNLMDGVTSTTAELNILDGVTSTAAELNILDGVTSTAAELNILDGVTSTATELNLLDGVTATTSELNILDGVTASAGDINLIDGITNGTVIASKAIVTDANIDITGGRNITITGELDAGSLDISGDADIDGTLEADAITIGGITLAETISDTVGAMVSSNTETNITVSYDDADNTLDFVIGTLNQDTTGNAATATALETARTIHGVSFDGTANIDLSEVIADTVGAMVSSNTETNITVAYQDDDNTLDFTIGTLNQDTTGNAATATALETARTIGGTSFDGTANIAVNLSATATALATARTIGGVSFDGTANIVPTTFNAATFSGDLNVDSGVLFADVSTNRVGINQTTPDVSLDLGANTDAVHVPVGTTAQRPGSPAAGYFRYNTTTSGFEGYTDSWGSIGGGGTAPILNTMTGDGSDTTLTLTSAPVNENATVVTIDGVLQHKDTYSISGTTLTFSEAPPTGTAVECITWVNTTVSSALLLEDADGDTKVQVEESSDEDKIRFDTGGTERMIIDSTGVGIGTSSPNYNLTSYKAGANANYIQVANGSTGVNSANGTLFGVDASGAGAGVKGSIRYKYGSSSGATTYMSFHTAGTSSGNDTERMRIDATGNVGIGTDSPSSLGTGIPTIDLKGNSSSQSDRAGGIRFTRYDGTSGMAIYNADGASYIESHSTYPLLITTNGSESMRIDSSGNVLVGKTYTAASVAGQELRAGGYTALTRSGGNPLELNRLTSDGTIVNFSKDGSTVGSIQSRAGLVSTIILDPRSGSLGTGITGSGANLSPTNGSGTEVDARNDIGTSTYRFKDLYLSGGVHLGGTGSANKLDDYEEGTWTVSEVNGQSTITTNRANYTKIGRMVFASASVNIGSTTNTNVLNLSLPFASSIASYYLGGGTVGFNTLSATLNENLRPNIENGASNVFFWYGDNSSHSLNVKCNEASTKRIDFFVQYQV
jgi:hypothetical protein